MEISVASMVRPIISKAIKDLAKKENIEPNDTWLCVHLRDKEGKLEGEIKVKYYLLLNKKVKENGNGGIHYLSFVRDILGLPIKLDLMGRDALSAEFFSNYIVNFAATHETTPDKIDIIVIPNKDNFDDFTFLITIDKKPVLKTNLEAVFP